VASWRTGCEPIAIDGSYPLSVDARDTRRLGASGVSRKVSLAIAIIVASAMAATACTSVGDGTSDPIASATRQRPSARNLLNLVSDPASGLVVLEGGLSGDPFTQDPDSLGLDDSLWAYDPASNGWALRAQSPVGAGPIEVDTRTGRLVKYVGIGVPFRPVSETWSYDGRRDAWSRMAPALSPPGRLASSLAYDAESDAFVLFGGSTADFELLDDTWAYDLDRDVWRRMAPASVPPPRFFHLMVYDDLRDRVMLWGGDVLPEFAQRPYLKDLTADDYAPVWEYDLDSNTWTEVKPAGEVPPLRIKAGMVFDPGTGRVIVHGGERFADGTAFGDTWAYDPATRAWTRLGDDGPKVTAHGMALAPDGSRILLFGGRPGDVRNQVTDELWGLDLSTSTWSPIAP
jgi:Galactose oxidase, central domain